MSVAAIRRQALVLLADWQQADGRFVGWAGDDSLSFKPSKQQPTIFPTILILDALADIPGAQTIVKRAAKYVHGQRHEQGSWGYWDRYSQAGKSEPYPDDLDDTACALAALHNAGLLKDSARHIGAFARLLVGSEIAAGGPYNTWLIDYKEYTQWKHVDVAVNANVGYTLAQQEVYPHGLQTYITELITMGKLQSDYYVGIEPTLYFLARWYKGSALAQLKQIVGNCLRTYKKTEVLKAALLVLAAKQLELAPKAYEKQITDLHETFDQKKGWLAAALYVDPVYKGKQHYGGSAALTTALALHALAFEVKTATKTVRNLKTSHSNDTIAQAVQSIPNSAAREQYVKVVRRVTAAGATRQITEPATIIAEAGSFKVPAEIITLLNQGSLHGWVAYTLYDDFLDGTANAQLLNLANMAHRRSYSCYLQALPDNSAFKQLTDQAFDTIDSANNWELTYARAARTTKNALKIPTLPDYGDYQVLADRSWGHSLSASGVLLMAAESYFATMQTFFKHFLIARQLHDDAHDWEEDLAGGQLSSVVTILLRDFGEPEKLDYQKSIADLRQLFWRQTMTFASEEICKHIMLARKALMPCKAVMDTTQLEGWLVGLEKATALALQTRDETVTFIEGFGGEHD